MGLCDVLEVLFSLKQRRSEDETQEQYVWSISKAAIRTAIREGRGG